MAARRSEPVERLARALAPIAFGKPKVWYTPHLKRMRRKLIRDARRRAQQLLAIAGTATASSPLVGEGFSS
jgi:hypothetical protein